MAFLHRFTLATFVATIVCLCFFISECDGIKRPRNFAHVYGKRASPDAYTFEIDGQKVSKFPMFPGEFQDDYVPSDDNFLMRREDAKVNAKANVGHMFGRDLYDNYPIYDVDNMYTNPELEEESVIDAPNVRDDEIFNIPTDRVDEPLNRRDRKRQLILDLLKSSPAARIEALSYLNDIRNNRHSNA